MDAQQVPLIQQVQKIADERVPAEDFQQQVDRWNRYQEGLDKIKHQCDIEGVRFRRRLRTSYSERRERNVKQMIAIGLISAAIYILAVGYYTLIAIEKPVNIYLPNTWNQDTWQIAEGIANNAAFIGVIMTFASWNFLWNRGKLPENIKFQCKPVLNIDDLYYLQKFVKGMAKEKHDPKVVLPELTMELPQSWIKQQSLLSVMDTMKGIRL